MTNQPKTITIYQTKVRIDNPIGDGRHNRAEWRSFLDKNYIPAGFVFGVDQDGNIHDRNTSSLVIDAARAVPLREALMKVATAPLEAVQPDESSVVDRLAKTLGLSVDELKQALIEATEAETRTQRKRVSQALGVGEPG